MQYFAHKSFLVTANKLEEDGILETLSFDMPVFKGEYLLCDEFGNCTAISERLFKENYVPVEKLTVIPEFTDEQIALNYAQNWSNLEDEDYIDSFQKKVRERNKLND